jgi:V8-like Glu-specific endopeptidase
MPKVDRPLTQGELAKYVGRPMKGDKAIEPKGRRAFQTVTFEGDDDSPPDVRVEPIRDAKGKTLGWDLASDRPLKVGIDVRKVGKAKLPAKNAKVPTELDAFLPGDKVLGDAVELAAPVRVQHLRRRNGQRVRPELLFGEFTRQTYTPTGNRGSAHSLVGRIIVTTSGGATYSGSAALVAKRAILTAAHVIPWFDVGNSLPFQAQFVPASFDGTSRFVRSDGTTAAAWCLGAWGYPGHAQGDDMAVWELSQPFGAEWGYFGYKTYTDDWEDIPCWRLNGYPGDMNGGQRPVRVVDFPITDDDSDGAGVELEYRADSSGGMSGGPVWGWFDKNGTPKPYVIGTHSGGEDNFAETRQNLAAGGPALSALIKWARDNWT